MLMAYCPTFLGVELQVVQSFFTSISTVFKGILILPFKKKKTLEEIVLYCILLHCVVLYHKCEINLFVLCSDVASY